jgi:uncharacterized protein (TIGR02646 family)
MIKVNRPVAPPFFESAKLKKLVEDLWKHYEKDTQQRMKFRTDLLKPIRKDLSAVFQNKCAYCETKIGITSDFDLENFRPKNVTVGSSGYLPHHYFWLAYDWNNLLPSCQVCNRHKRSLFPLTDESKRAKVGDTGSQLLAESPLLLDPCYDRPEEHLIFKENGLIEAKSLRGSATIELLHLNREPLVHARQNAAVMFKSKLQGKISPKEIADLLSEKPSHEYAAVLRSVLEIYQQKLQIFDEVISVNKESLQIVNNIEYQSTLQYIRELKTFSIKSIEISNFRTIEHLKLDIKPTNTDTERESWMLLLGDNGVGKTSILQAIALVLCGEPQFKSLGLNVLDYLRKDQEKGYIKIESFEQTDPLTVTFSAKGFKGMLKEPPAYILGYGATRLLPRRGLSYSAPPNPFVNILNLFDYSYPLNDVNTWLRNVDPDTFNNRIAPALFDLLDLKDGERVQISEQGRLEVKDSNGLVDLEKASDGYKSIIALACDIMKTLSNDPSGYHSAGGIVLVDELGNHLHPRWRLKIVDALRTAFPKLQFIVSTHEPLCLRGLLHGEVVVLAETSENKIIAIDQHLLPDHSLMKIDQLLTSDLFGLINTFDKETEQRYDDYYRLLSIPANERSISDTNKISRYTRFFAGREMLGSTPQVQAVYEIVNEKFANNLLKSDYKTQETLKQETVKEVKEMLDLGNLDWL